MTTVAQWRADPPGGWWAETDIAVMREALHTAADTLTSCLPATSAVSEGVCSFLRSVADTAAMHAAVRATARRERERVTP